MPNRVHYIIKNMTSDLVLGGQKKYLAKNFIKIGRKTKFYKIWGPPPPPANWGGGVPFSEF